VVGKKPNGPIGIVREKIFGIPVDRSILFTNHKRIYKKGIEKRQRKLVIKVPFIKPFLENDEMVLLITTGYSPLTSFEKYIIGWFFIYLKRSLFIFTNKRIFHVPTTPIYSYRHIISHIIYKHCRSISLNGSTLVVNYLKLGLSERFIGFAGKERKRINELLKSIPMKGRLEGATVRTNICPRCTSILLMANNQCTRCKLKFKTGMTAKLLSVLSPGGGYFYVRQYYLGMLTAIIEIALLILAGLLIFDISKGVTFGIWWLVIILAALTLSKTVAIFHVANFIREIIPQKRSVTS